jgi:SAM-dependent methyltransferase
MLPAEYQAMHLAELRHWWFRGRRGLLLSLLARFGDPQVGPLRILDYGCGTGGNTTFYGASGWTIGIEPDAFAVRTAHARGGASYCRASGTKLPFRAGIFDVVMASDVLEHIEDDDAAILEIARVLRPGGRVIICVPAHQWLFASHDYALQHYRRYSKGELRHLLNSAGFQIRLLSYWNTVLFPLVCVYRLVRQNLHHATPCSDNRLPPRPINEALVALLAGESWMVGRLSLPWGVSLVAVAESYDGRPPHSSSARSKESARAGGTADSGDARRNMTARESQYHTPHRMSLASS